MRIVLITLLLFLALSGTNAQPKPELIPYKQGKLWGYSNRSGQIVLQPQWAVAGFFRNGKARVATTMHGPWAIINTKGAYLLPPERNWNGEWRGFRGTSLNFSDSSGNMGMLDTNNRVLLPAIYSNPRRPFQWRAAWNACFLEVSKEGRRGIIDSQGRELLPFVFTSLTYLETIDGDPWGILSMDPYKRSEAPSYDSSMLAPIIAFRDEKYALLDIHGHELVPFGVYDNLRFIPPRWITCYKGKQTGMLNALGQVIIPLQNGQLSAIGQHWFTVQTELADGRTRTGVINESGDTVIPFRYSRIAASKQSIELAIADSTPPPEIRRKYRKHEIVVGEYTMHLGLQDLKPIDSWTYKEFDFDFNRGGRYCGQYYQDGMQRYYEHAPVVFRNDSALRSFDMDGISWTIVARGGEGLVAVEGYDIETRRKPYSAIVDEQLHYLVYPRPGDDKAIYYNRQDGLILSYKGGSYQRRTYSVEDIGSRTLLKDVSACLALPFRWKESLYVMSAGANCGGGIDVDPFRNQGQYKMLLDGNGEVVTALKPYHLLYMATWDGRRANQFEGYFFALDSFSRPGIIDISGNVVYPAVSFQDKPGQIATRAGYYGNLLRLDAVGYAPVSYLAPVGNGWFVFDHRWVDSNMRELLPGIHVESLMPASYTPFHTAGWLGPLVDVPGVYKLEYKVRGEGRYCYVTENGVVHANSID